MKRATEIGLQIGRQGWHRLAIALKLFEMKRLSLGQAASLAGIDRTTFLMQLSEQRVAVIDLPPEELADDVRHAGPK